MGNQLQAEQQRQLIGASSPSSLIESDLPPKRSLSEWDDSELLLRVKILQSTQMDGPCSEITRYMGRIAEERSSENEQQNVYNHHDHNNTYHNNNNNVNNSRSNSSHSYRAVSRRSKISSSHNSYDMTTNTPTMNLINNNNHNNHNNNNNSNSNSSNMVNKLYDEEIGSLYWSICALSYLDQRYSKCMISKFGGANDLIHGTVREFYRNVRGGSSVLGSNHTGLSQVVLAADECLTPELNSSFSERLNRLTSSGDVEDELLTREFEPMVHESVTALDSNDVSMRHVQKKLKETRLGACQRYVPPDMKRATADNGVVNSVNFTYQYTKFQQCAIANMCANEIRSCMTTTATMDNDAGSFTTCLAQRDYGSQMEKCVSRVRDAFASS